METVYVILSNVVPRYFGGKKKFNFLSFLCRGTFALHFETVGFPVVKKT